MEDNSDKEILQKNGMKNVTVENVESQINLIESIKSLFIIKNIFSFLKECSKLNLIIYNKKFQTKLGIDIEYYKTVSGRVKLLDKNGYGKEYKLNTDILVFEGEYIKGKRNGKGKEYFDNNKLKFEGTYLNGKRSGFGKEYCDNGILKFEGE